MSNSVAHFLRKQGVTRNDIVPIISKRSWHFVVATLGVLKAGAAFLPIDPSFPFERIDFIVQEVKTKIILSYGKKCNELRCNVVELEKFNYFYDVTSVMNINKSDDACYVLFTSGTTGNPKGTIQTHKNLVNFVNSNKRNIFQQSICCKCNSFLADIAFTFDPTMFHIYLPLLNGLRIILTPEDSDSRKVAEIIEKNCCDIINSTPTKIKVYLRDVRYRAAISGLKIVTVGAEIFTEELYKEIEDCTNADIYNVYGPTETTIISSAAQIVNTCKKTDIKDITIGSPIANTQIYILDRNNKPLPIGVAGELCIAGDGVGKGYLNRPELTAEKFVSNPFATKENHHGRIMYHTGDLACWRADGKIEYLGRIDTQVKIRGLRIELGEIENVMSSFQGVQLTAVADKRDENNRQYLVGYYTCDHKIDEKSLRNHLLSKIPKYMIPNYFVKLNNMPMTISGKIDRKKLPLPHFTMREREYVKPETEQEKKLCKLLETLLHMEKIGVEDDFFEYGGDSLTAIEYVAKAHDMGIEVALQNVFDYPTVKKLCDFLNEGTEEKVHYNESDFNKYNGIFSNNIIDNAVAFEKKSLGNVLLTGATGFLGAHILDQLMRVEKCKIYCLIRANNDDGGGKLKNILRYYFGDKYEAQINRRIIPVVGDIERKGLSDELPENVQTVIHTAASVKHYGLYSYFHRVNVEGTGHVVDYAKKLGAKLIHVSTLSVSGNSMVDDFTVYHSEEEKNFYETSFYIGQPMDNVYIRSKFEAEKRVYDAMLDGLDAVVIRVGNLTNRMSDYKFQPNFKENAFLTRVKAILELGLLPDYIMNLYTEFSPVDKTAEGIIKIAQYVDKQRVFHLNSDKVIYLQRFIEVLHELGISMEIVSGNIFNKALRKTLENKNTEYIYEALQNDIDEQGQLVYDSNIHIKNGFTQWFLKQIGFEWNEIDIKYISGYVDYFRKIGYLEV